MATKKVNIDIIAKDKTRKAMQSATKGIDGVKKSVFNLKNALIGIGAGIAIKGFVDVGRTVEDLQVRLKQLFGSTEEGAKAFDVMANFAAKVPFSLEQIQAASGNLAVVAGDADRLAKILEITGNVAAVTGLDFQTTGEQIQRAFAGGIASADIFREKGVRDLLGFKAGATVSAEETIAAFEKVFGKGGKFGTATDELANTFTGTLSMLSDSVFKFQKRVADKEFFASLKKEFQLLDEFIKENEATFNDIADVIGGALAGAVKLLSGAIKAIAISVDGVTTAYEFLIETLNKLPLVNIKLITKEQRQLQRELMSYEDTIMRIVRLRDEELKATIQTSLATKRASEANKKTQEEAKKTFNIFESHHKLVKAVEDAEKRRTERLIKGNRNIFEEQKKIEELFKPDRTAFEGFKEGLESEFDITIFDRFKEAGETSLKSLKNNITDFIMTGKLSFKSLKDTIIRSIVEALVGQAVTKGLKKATEIFKMDAIKKALISVYEGALKTFASIPFPFNIAAVGAALSFGFGLVNKIKSFEKGGRPAVGQPAIIGEKGAELFVPDQAGTIVPNNQLGMGKPVTVNFNINTVDARGFNELLVNSRGVIVNMINSAVNEKGKAALI